MVRWMLKTAAFALLAAGVFGLTGCNQSGSAKGVAKVGESVPAQASEGWLTSLDEGLAVAKKSGKMVLVDFAADW